MPVKTRAANGRFEINHSSPTKNEEENKEQGIIIQKEMIWKIAKAILVFLLISPWIFLAMRRNTFDNVTKKITDFYDDNFSCSSICLCDTKNVTSDKSHINPF